MEEAAPGAEIHLFEQNPAGATWGFGVVFSERALDFLREDDPERSMPSRRGWRRGATSRSASRRGVAIDGVGFSAIGRLELLRLLQARVRAAGVDAALRHAVGSLEDLDGCDLIVAADGVNSLVRRTIEDEFGTSVTHLDQQVRLVRHHPALRDADPDLLEHRSAPSTRITTATRPT